MQTAISYVCRSTLLLLSTLAYQYSSIPPNLTGRTEHSSRDQAKVEYKDELPAPFNGIESESTVTTSTQRTNGVTRTSFGEKVEATVEVHDAQGSFLPFQAKYRHWKAYILWCLTVLDIASRSLSFAPKNWTQHALPYLCPSSSTPPRSQISYTFILLATSVLFGGLLRHACYTALGRMFTFAHTTRENHVLVTWGPYSYARHVGYSAIVLVFLGSIGMLWLNDGWLIECTTSNAGNDSLLGVPGIIGLLGHSLVTLYSAWTLSVMIALIRRAPREDATLKARFGEQWEAYRKTVPWSFVPYVL